MWLEVVAYTAAVLWVDAKSRWYPTETMTDTDYADDLALLANIPAQTESLLHNPEQAAGGIGLHKNTNETEFT